MLSPESRPNGNTNFNQLRTADGRIFALVLNPKKFSENALRLIITRQIESIVPKELAIMSKDHSKAVRFVTVEEIIALKTLPEEEKEKKISDIVGQMKNAETIHIMTPASSNRDLQSAFNPSKYSLQIRSDVIVETFATQHLSEKELQTLLEKLAADQGPKRITFENPYGNTILFETLFVPGDENLTGEARRSDTIVVEHNVFTQRKDEDNSRY